MFGHDDVPEYPHAIAAANFLQGIKKSLGEQSVLEVRQSVMTTEGHEVRLAGFVIPL